MNQRLISKRSWAAIACLVSLGLLVIVLGASVLASPATNTRASKISTDDVTELTKPVVQKGERGEGVYIVRLDGNPLATYRGGVDGLAATSPVATGAAKLDMTSRSVLAYQEHLLTTQAGVISQLEAELNRSVDVRFQYTAAYNGFAVVLNPEEAATLRQMPGVVSVNRETMETPLTDYGPEWIGATDVWTGIGAPMTQGEGVIVGILDTGINSDHPSFADIGGDGYDHTNPFGAGNYVGVCDPLDPSYQPGFVCNDKLIGAWTFVSEPTTPEDSDGHGSHTGSTSAGNIITASIDGPTLSYTATFGGVAPHANIIAYDVCVTNCPGAALIAAVDQATLDGVDVINYSISGGENPYADDVELGFLNATDAGVFVSASAGNSGPGPSTVAHRSPWVATVAASTHNRAFPNTLMDMTGGTPPADIVGKGFTVAYGPAPIVYAADFPNANDPGGDPAQCLQPYPAGTFMNGEIVLCDRGAIARVAKGQNVLAGGAGGFVLGNDAGNGASLVGDAHFLPGVHISFSDAELVRAWLSANPVGSLTATISGAVLDTNPANGDIMAGFSSRGPNDAFDVLKPDVTAPGVDIIAARNDGGAPVAPEMGFSSGTSMSSPHNAGAGALMSALYPSWSSSAIKSALMSTAVTAGVLKEDGATAADPFDIGGGSIRVNVAANVGLVWDETTANYAAADPNLGGDVKSLNLPSVYNSACVGICSWTRTVTSVAGGTLEYSVSTTDAWLTAEPANFIVGPGGTQVITVTADVSGVPLDAWYFSQVDINPFSNGGGNAVAGFAPVAQHMTAAVYGTGASLPELVEINTRRNAGSVLVEDVVAGSNITDLTAEWAGLTPAIMLDMDLAEDPTNGDPYDDLSQVFWITATVPAGMARLVAEVVASEAPDADLFWGADLDGDGPEAGEELGSSTTGSWPEYLSTNDPPGGTYWVLVQNWAGSGAPTDAIRLAVGMVPSLDSGNASISDPGAVPAGSPFDFRVFWDTPGMTEGDVYYGVMSLNSTGTALNGGFGAGDLGNVDVNLYRDLDDVVKEVSQPTAVPSDTLTYSITVRSNVTSEDLTYWITDTIPAGMTYVPASASATAGTVDVTGDLLTWTGVQAAPGFAYVMTDNNTDPQCDTPFGGYVDLWTLAAFDTDSALTGDSITWSYGSQAGTDFYGTNRAASPVHTDDGFATYGDPGAQPWVNQNMPDPADPNDLMASMWRDWVIEYAAATGPTEPEGGKGITAATYGSGWMVEYDDVEDWPGSGDGTAPAMDFEVLALYAADPTPGTPEIFFAYDNVISGSTLGTIGIENAGGSSALQYAFDSIVPTDGLVVCFDWQAQGGSDIVITFQATVDADTDGIVTNTALHQTDNPGSMEDMAMVDVDVIGTPTAVGLADLGTSGPSLALLLAQFAALAMIVVGAVALKRRRA